MTAEELFNEGLREFRRNDYELAIRDFKDALRLKVDFVEAYYYLGQAYERLGSRGPAEQAYLDAVSYDARYLPVREAYGLMLFNQRRDDDAEVQLSVARQLGSVMPEVYFSLGSIKLKKRDCKEAIALLREALRLNPSYYEAKDKLKEAMDRCAPRKAAPTPKPREEKSFRGGAKAIDPEEF
jgi:Tfp pilus assembly protein PilF